MTTGSRNGPASWWSRTSKGTWTPKRRTPFQGAGAFLLPMKVHSRRGPVSGEDIRQLLFACQYDTSVLGRRDAAILYLLAVMAVPARAVSSLNLADGESAGYPEEARTLLSEWIEVRGREPGPLFLATRSASNISPRRLSPSAMNLVFLRRCQDAGVPPFTQSDVLRTRSALQCGQWTAGCCELEPGTIQPGMSLRAVPVVRALRRMSSAKRRTATQLLDLFASQLDPPATALTVPWNALTSEAMKLAVQAVAAKEPVRRVNALKRCLYHVLEAATEAAPILASGPVPGRDVPNSPTIRR